MRFFSDFLGGPALTYDFPWLRLVDHEESTCAHYDIVSVGHGTADVLTCWTPPLGAVGYDQGPLAICVGSHREEGFAMVRATYGRMDVDRDRVAGWFTTDPVEIVDRFGGRWATSEFQPGDALIFGMYTRHASLVNVSDRFRLTSDTRYLLASEAVDERWIGRAAPSGAVPRVLNQAKRCSAATSSAGSAVLALVARSRQACTCVTVATLTSPWLSVQVRVKLRPPMRAQATAMVTVSP